MNKYGRQSMPAVLSKNELNLLKLKVGDKLIAGIGNEYDDNGHRISKEVKAVVVELSERGWFRVRTEKGYCVCIPYISRKQIHGTSMAMTYRFAGEVRKNEEAC